MKRLLVTLVTMAAFGASGLRAEAQTVSQVFKRVNSSVVIVRTTERDVEPQAVDRVPGVGSGVLIAAEGRVLTAAHVVHAVAVARPRDRPGRPATGARGSTSDGKETQRHG
jgi:hypothetical protein